MHTVAETHNFARSWEGLLLSEELRMDVINHLANHPTEGEEIIAETGIREIEFEIIRSYGSTGDSLYTVVSFYINDNYPLYLLDVRQGSSGQWTIEERQVILQEINGILSGL